MGKSLTKVVAGVSAAILAAALVGVFLFVYALGASKGSFGARATFLGAFIYSILMAIVIFAPLGIVPGALLMFVTRIGLDPWRSLRRFVPLSAIGGFALCFPWSLRPGSDAAVIVTAALYVIGFTAGGLVAAWLKVKQR